MMRYFSKSLIVLITGAVWCGQVAIADADGGEAIPEETVSVGKATHEESGRGEFLEYYLDDPLADRVRAQYRSQDGDLLATKQLKFTPNAAMPAFEMHDYRTSRGYRVVPRGDSMIVQSLRLLGNNMSAVVEVDHVDVVEPVVIDAGFHRFVLQHWEQIAAGEKVRFNFLQVDRARLVPLLVRKDKCVRAEHYCVKVTAKNPFLRLFMPQVKLAYNAKTRQLLKYTGIGPLPTERGNALPVELNYSYQQ